MSTGLIHPRLHRFGLKLIRSRLGRPFLVLRRCFNKERNGDSKRVRSVIVTETSLLCCETTHLEEE